MKTTITNRQDQQLNALPPHKERVHRAVMKIRPDLYQDGNVPELEIAFAGGLTTVNVYESNNKLSCHNSMTSGTIRRYLLSGNVYVSDMDIEATLISTADLITEAAVKRPRKLGRWD